MNKNNLLGTVTVLGVLAIIFAAWANITHQAYAKTSMTIGFLLAGIAVASLVWFFFVWLGKKAN